MTHQSDLADVLRNSFHSGDLLGASGEIAEPSGDSYLDLLNAMLAEQMLKYVILKNSITKTVKQIETQVLPELLRWLTPDGAAASANDYLALSALSKDLKYYYASFFRAAAHIEDLIQLVRAYKRIRKA